MASHVIVLDSSARRAIIKTTPSKHLSDILQEACSKLGVDGAMHGLKNSNSKSVDLSQPFRLSGLSSGAKLQLVTLSRSPSVISVALQLPEHEADGLNRLTGRFPSTITLWLMLRQFESRRNNREERRNFTARSVPQIKNGEETGSGRLYYETPVIQIMGRELVSFTDLQKTMAQLGYNNGSVLLRLSFRRTEIPLEEAMADIEGYFKFVEGDDGEGEYSRDDEKSETELNRSASTLSDDGLNHPSLLEPLLTTQAMQPVEEVFSVPVSPQQLKLEATEGPYEPAPSHSNSIISSGATVAGPSQRLISIYAPPSASTPAAARQSFNERDYEPTVDHARLHQSRLAASGRNKRLPTDAELAERAKAQSKRNTDVQAVKIKIRFPDQSAVVSTFSNIDTSITLYDFVRGLIAQEHEPFCLSFSTNDGPQAISRTNTSTLIRDLSMVGRVLVNFMWADGASNTARTGNVLKRIYQDKAKEIVNNEVRGTEEEQEEAGAGKERDKMKGNKRDKKGGVPVWLKLPGKK